MKVVIQRSLDSSVEVDDKPVGKITSGFVILVGFNRDDNIVIKLWEPGRPFQIFNRVDIELLNSNYWVIGMIVDINNEKEQLCIKYTDKEKNIREEWINLHSQRIAQVGLHTRGVGTGSLLSAEEINQKLFKNRKFITLNEDQEEKIKKNIEKLHFFICVCYVNHLMI